MQDTEDLKFAILVATGAMLMMAFFVISFVMLYQKRRFEEETKLNEIEKNHHRKLLETALSSAETERRRIAQDLHDDIGTMLSLTKLSINQLSKIVPVLDEKDSLIIQKSQSLVEETIIHVRRITRDLVPTTLERFGISDAISEFINRLEPSIPINITFNFNGDDIPRQHTKVELTLFRIMQELVNNAIKHAHCDFIEIGLFLDDAFINLMVTDNGVGFNPEQLKVENQVGLGLLGIESRLTVVNGIISYTTPAAGGSKATVRIPFNPTKESSPGTLHPYSKKKNQSKH
tara:strand:- start:339 stop:1205 length:867 start_codon:yes stop_codon:yes gene_type:complete